MGLLRTCVCIKYASWNEFDFYQSRFTLLGLKNQDIIFQIIVKSDITIEGDVVFITD